MKMFSSLYIVLASMSRYRAECLQKIPLQFEQIAPHIDETPLDNESPQSLVIRLAKAKAEKVMQMKRSSKVQPTHVLASDQTLICDNIILGKPQTFEKAKEQLTSMAGKKVEFLTSLVLINSETNQVHEAIDQTNVYFRPLSEQTIHAYLKFETPYDCAGSFKSEGSGILLCERIEGRDPNSLIGLPLALLMDFLSAEGYNPFV